MRETMNTDDLINRDGMDDRMYQSVGGLVTRGSGNKFASSLSYFSKYDAFSVLMQHYSEETIKSINNHKHEK